LHQAGAVETRLTLEVVATPRDIAWADLIIFCRNVEPRYAHLLAAAQQLGRPYIYDLDDNFFEVPLTYEAGRYLRTPERQAQLRAYLAGAALVRVYAEPLQQRIIPINGRVEKVRPSLDWSLIPAQLPPKHGQRLRIVYATSRLDDALVNLITPDLHQLLNAFPEQVELVFWGHHPPALRHHPQVSCLPYEPDYDRFLRQLALAGFDIGLAPLLDDEFHRSKTNNKFREYAACQIAGVYSDVDVYSHCVTEGETGLLVGFEPGAWSSALSRLVQDAALRQRVQRQAAAYVREHYRQAETEQVWLRQIHSVLTINQHKPTADPPRLPPPAPGTVTTAQWAQPLAVAQATFGNGIKLAKRMRHLGLGPSLTGARRYLYSLWQLRRYTQQLKMPRAS
jgi:glycosyltransferase involved in cell wall biosynthesis